MIRAVFRKLFLKTIGLDYGLNHISLQIVNVRGA